MKDERTGKKYRIELSEDEITRLEALCAGGTHPARTVLYARALLLLDRGEHAKCPMSALKASAALGVSTRTLSHLKERYIKTGLEGALCRKSPQAHRKTKTKFGSTGEEIRSLRSRGAI
jgi:hypothetical protein